MKKSAIALAVFVAALFAVSCQKETTPEQNVSGPMTVSAVTEGIGVGAKADLAYKYDVIWRTGDKICVKNSEKSVEFTLSGGEGTTKGTFSSETSITGEVEGFYPASVANLVWPAEQQNNQVPPMYSKKNLTSTQNQTFNFTSLGSELQLTFSTTSENVILKSIEVKADQAMSGAFTINEGGQAVISQPEGDKPGVTLDLGDTGVALGVTAKKFNIAIPAGTYTNLTITFTAKNGQKCTKHATKAQSIEYNTVNTLAISGEFKADVPDGALPGVFSVGPNATDKVHFSQGNLYAKNEGTTESPDWKWHFYDKQYTFLAANMEVSGSTNWPQRTVDANETEIDLFTWGYDNTSSNDSYSLNPVNTKGITAHTGLDQLVYDKASSKGGDDWGVAYCESNNIRVGNWRTLTTEEWQYLFNTRTDADNKVGYATVNDVKGIIILPDTFIDPQKSGGSTAFAPKSTTTGWTANIYTTGGNWEAMESAGAVFLPAAGNRSGSSNVFNVGSNGYYWSSTAYGSNDACSVIISSSSVNPINMSSRNLGCSVRLITESK